jgi:anti-anti-sigma factor
MIVRITEPQLCGDVVAEVLKLQLSQRINARRPQRLLIDLQVVKAMSSSVIGALLSIKRQLDRLGGRLILCAMPVSLREIYRTMGLDGNVFDVWESLPQTLLQERRNVHQRCRSDA